jgi:hypothetical protein
MPTKMTLEIADAPKTAERLRLCPECQGEGARRSTCEYEQAQGIMDTCYHCVGGYVTEDVYQDDLRAAFVARVAAMRVQLKVDLAGSLPEEDGGWDYQLAAAENGLAVSAYLQECAWAQERDVRAVLEALPAHLVASCMEAL